MINISNIKITGRLNGTTLGSAESYWFATLMMSADPTSCKIAVDSLSNIYLSGGTVSENDAFLIKISKEGEIVFQQKTGNSSTRDLYENSCLDQLGNIYSLGTSNIDGNYNVLISKRNADGTHIWTRTVGQSHTADYGHSISVDITGNIYLVGYADYSNDYAFLIKLDNNGDILWTKFCNISGDDRFYGVHILENSVIVGGYATVTSKVNPYFLEFNSTDGSVIWQKRYVPTSNFPVVSTAIDNNKNMYGIGTSGGRATLCKINQDLTLAWAKSICPSTSSGNNMVLDSSGYIYAVWNHTSQGHAMLGKFDLNGNTVFVRNIKSVSGSSTGLGVSLDANDNICLSGFITTDISRPFIARLPNNGTLTGTYGDFIYEEGTDYSLSIALPPATATAPFGNLTATSTTPPLSETTIDYTISVNYI